MPPVTEESDRGEGGRRRVVIERVEPELDGGRFAIKRTLGERVVVEGDAFADGHDAITCLLLYRREPLQEAPRGGGADGAAGGELPERPAGPASPAGRAGEEGPAGPAPWIESPMEALGNDRWRGELRPSSLGRWVYTITAWVDPFKTWRRDLIKRVEAAQEVGLELRVGAGLVREAGERAREAGRLSDARVLGPRGDALAQAPGPAPIPSGSQPAAPGSAPVPPGSMAASPGSAGGGD